MKRAPPPPPNRKNPPPPPSRIPKPMITEMSDKNQQSPPNTTIGQFREPERPEKLEIDEQAIVPQPQVDKRPENEANINNQSNILETNIEQPQIDQELGQTNNQILDAQKQASFPVKSMVPPKMVPPPVRGNLKGKIPVPKAKGGPPPPPPPPKISTEISEPSPLDQKQQDNNIVPQKKEQQRMPDQSNSHQRLVQSPQVNTALEATKSFSLPTRKILQVPPPQKNSPKAKIPPAFTTAQPKLIQETEDKIRQESFQTKVQDINLNPVANREQQQNIQIVQQRPLSIGTTANEVTSPSGEKSTLAGQNMLLQKLKRLQKAKEEMTNQNDEDIEEKIENVANNQTQQSHSSTLQQIEETPKVQPVKLPTTQIKLQQKAIAPNRKIPAPPLVIKNPPRSIPQSPVTEQTAPIIKQASPLSQNIQDLEKLEPIRETEAPKIQVNIPNPPPKSPMLIEINTLLERYHNVKAVYLSNLKELDDQINFHRNQEQREVEKINHLIHELSKKNEKIRQLCQIRSVSNNLESEQLEEAAV